MAELNPSAATPSPLEQEVLEEYALLLANLNKVCDFTLLLPFCLANILCLVQIAC